MAGVPHPEQRINYFWCQRFHPWIMAQAKSAVLAMSEELEFFSLILALVCGMDYRYELQCGETFKS